MIAIGELFPVVAVDPSPRMPFWDKSRLLLHGRLTTAISEMKWQYLVTLDPYCTTEIFDWTWSEAITDWTNGNSTLFHTRRPSGWAEGGGRGRESREGE